METDQHDLPIVKRLSVLGAPVRCVQLVSSDVCLYSQGPFVHRLVLRQKKHEQTEPPRESDHNCLLVWDETGTNISGIRIVSCQNKKENRANGTSNSASGTAGNGSSNSTGNSNNDRNPDLITGWDNVVVVFGGRYVTFLCGKSIREHRSQPMQMLPIIRSSPQQESSAQHQQQKNDKFLTFRDWVWDCQILRIPQDHDNRSHYHEGCNSTDDSMTEKNRLILVVGLAHNEVQVYQVTTVCSSFLTNSSHRRIDEQLEPKPQDRPLSPNVLVDIAPRPQLLRGTTRSILYSMQFCYPLVAIGTVLSHDIRIWSLHQDNRFLDDKYQRKSTEISLQANPHTAVTATTFIMDRSNLATTNDALVVPESYILTGHQGAVHSIAWGRSGQCLASVSDDRTVRFWDRQDQQTSEQSSPQSLLSHSSTLIETQWKLRWTAWGHCGRTWSVAIAESSFPSYVASTGDDGTARLWDIQTGSNLAVLKGHDSQSIWCVSIWEDLLVTGAHNGSLAFYNPSHRLSTTNGLASSMWSKSFHVPDDARDGFISIPDFTETNEREINEEDDEDRKSRNNQPDNMTTTNVRDKMNRKGKPQVIVGTQFLDWFPLTNAADKKKPDATKRPHLLLATRAGSLMVLDALDGNWTHLQPWILQSSPSMGQGCCMRAHPSFSIVAIGTTSGDIVLSALLPTNVDGDRRMVLPTNQYRAVQRLEWVSSTTLLSFNVEAVLMISFPDLLHDPSAGVYRTTQWDARVLSQNTRSRGLAISAAMDKPGARIILGDTRGNLCLYDLRMGSTTTNASTPAAAPAITPTLKALVFRPCSVQHGVHQTEHVNDVLWGKSNSGNEKVFSVGNDGCLVESVVDSDGRLVPLLSISLWNFSSIVAIWNEPLRSDGVLGVVVGGYCGNIFSIVDASGYYEFMSFDTGGRQRYLEIKKAQNCILPTNMGLAVTACQADGSNEILLSVCHSNSLATDSSTLWYSAGSALHSETIFDCCMHIVGNDGQSFILVTGSEDCSSRICYYRNGSSLRIVRLPSQASGVRAVCTSSHHNSESVVIAIGGGGMTIQFFVVQKSPQNPSDIQVLTLGQGRSSEMATIDQRINVVASISFLIAGKGKRHFFFTGDSEGRCLVYIVSEDEGQENPIGHIVYRDQRPILSLAVLKLGSKAVLVVGTTAGSVHVILVNLTDQLTPPSPCYHEPALSYQAHSVGANAIDVMRDSTHNNAESIVLRIISAGDDQALCLCELHISSSKARIHQMVTKNGSSISAFKGVTFLDDYVHFVTTGYDQRLRIWRIQGTSLDCIFSTVISVGDVNCHSHLFLGSHLIAVCGVGVEVFCFEHVVKNE